MTSSHHILSEGQVVHEKWEILNFLAEGGKGDVYLARQINLDRHVALKIMSSEFLKSLEGRDEEYASCSGSGARCGSLPSGPWPTPSTTAVPCRAWPSGGERFMSGMREREPVRGRRPKACTK
jgi:serine/threonine protein kinase